MKEGRDPSGEVVLPPVELVHKYLDPDLRGYMIGREHLYFRYFSPAISLIVFVIFLF